MIELQESSNEFLVMTHIQRKYPPLSLVLPGRFVEIIEDIGKRCNTCFKPFPLTVKTFYFKHYHQVSLYKLLDIFFKC